MDANERRIVQEIKTIANLEHRDNPYNSSWGIGRRKAMNNQEYIDTFNEVRDGYTQCPLIR